MVAVMVLVLISVCTNMHHAAMSETWVVKIAQHEYWHTASSLHNCISQHSSTLSDLNLQPP